MSVRSAASATSERLVPRTAASLVDSPYAVYAVGIAATPELYAASARDSRRVVDALEPWDSGRDYLNFRETRSTGSRLFSPAIHERLQGIKRCVDPANVIRSNHQVSPARASASSS